MESFNQYITIENLDNKQEIRILIEGDYEEADEDCQGFWFIKASIYHYSGVKMNFVFELFSERVFGEYSQSEIILIAKLSLANYYADIQKKLTDKSSHWHNLNWYF